MAYTGILCTENDVKYLAGANASSTAIAEAYLNVFVQQAESVVNAATNKNWSDAYSGLNTDKKYILSQCVAALAAMCVINYDTTNFIRDDAVTSLNFLRDLFSRNLELLKEDKVKTFVVA